MEVSFPLLSVNKITNGRYLYHMNIGILLITIVGGAAGIFSTLYLTISLPAVLIWKVYRRMHLGIPMTK